MDIGELREYSKKLAYSGEEYHQIKEELMKLNLELGLVELILNEVDQNIVEYQLILQEKERLLNQMIIGALFFLIGIGITVYTYFTLQRQYLLMYGAILVGAWMFIENYKKYKRPMENFIAKNRRFKKNRFQR